MYIDLNNNGYATAMFFDRSAMGHEGYTAMYSSELNSKVTFVEWRPIKKTKTYQRTTTPEKQRVHLILDFAKGEIINLS